MKKSLLIAEQMFERMGPEWRDFQVLKLRIAVFERHVTSTRAGMTNRVTFDEHSPNISLPNAVMHDERSSPGDAVAVRITLM